MICWYWCWIFEVSRDALTVHQSERTLWHHSCSWSRVLVRIYVSRAYNTLNEKTVGNMHHKRLTLNFDMKNDFISKRRPLANQYEEILDCCLVLIDNWTNVQTTIFPVFNLYSFIQWLYHISRGYIIVEQWNSVGKIGRASCRERV